MKKVLILAAAIVLMAVVAFGAISVLHHSDRSSTQQITEKHDFTVYNNPQYGFLFSYPVDWKLTKLNDNDTILNFDATDGSRMTVYALDYSGTGISSLLKKKEEKAINISGTDASEQVWLWNQQAPKAGQTGLIVVRMNAAGGPLELDFQPAVPEDLPHFQDVLNSLKL